MATVLSVGPDRDLLACRNRALARLGFEVHGAATREDALAAARSRRFDLALLCDTFPRGYATAFADALAALMPGTPVVQLQDGNTALSAEYLQDIIEGAGARPKAA